MFFPKDYAAHERHVIETADKFIACSFIGRAQYDKRESKTLSGAQALAGKIIAERTSNYSKGRPVLVYAVAGVHQVVAATVTA